MRHLPAAVEKSIVEGGCRVCSRTDVETAHLWPRGRGAPKYDDPDICIPLCKRHHGLYDRHAFDILPWLTLAEQVALVIAAGGIAKAYNQASGDARSGFLRLQE